MVNGTHSIRFAIYNTDRTTVDPYPSDTDKNSRIWEETQNVEIKSGVFNIELGKINNLPTTLNKTNTQFYLAMRVENDSEMVPRKKIAPSFFALNSENAITLNGKKIGNQSGDIPILNQNGQIDIQNLPIGTNSNQLVLGNDKRFTLSVSGQKYFTISGQQFKLNKVDLTSDIQGTLPISQGGTGITATPQNGQIPIGNGSSFSLATINSGLGIAISNTQGNITIANTGVLSLAGTTNQINLTSATGNITLSLPQDINPNSSVQFGSLALGSPLAVPYGGTGNTTFDTGSIIFSDGLKFLGNKTNFFWDNINNRLGIGNDNPTVTLDVTGNAKISNNLAVDSISTNSINVSGQAVMGALGQNIYVNSSIVPQVSGLNLGSSLDHWSSLYVDNLSVGSTNSNGTSNPYFIINTSATTEANMGLRFYLGPTSNTYASLNWDAINHLFNLYKKENDGSLADLNLNNLNALNVNLSGQLISTAPQGTAPFQVASTTKVANLNADLLDGFDSSAFGDATAANQTEILTRIGTNADGASMSSTLFAGLKYISAQINVPLESNVKLGTTYGVNNNGALTPSSGATTTITALASDVVAGKLFFGANSSTWTPSVGTYTTPNLNELTGSAGSSVATYALYPKSKGGVDDYNNGGAIPADTYTSNWTTCDPTNNYCATGDYTNTDKLDGATGLIWSKWLDSGNPHTWFWANNCYEPGDTNNPGTCVNNGDTACGCVKKTASLVGCEALGNGWRLPSQKELMQVYIDGSWGKLTSAGNGYWSATTNSNATQLAWDMNLGNGYTNNSTKTNSASYRVRCVR